jgi:hypothetical protein
MKLLPSALLMFALAGPLLQGTAFAQDLRHEDDPALMRPESRQSWADAQREARAALAQAQQECRRERDRDQRDRCLRDAKEDHDRQLAEYGHGHR